MSDHSGFPRIEGLFDLACRNGVDVRPTLLRVLTDLYVQARSHSAAEEAQYVELALRLIDNVDDATRVAVAKRLAGCAHAPAAVSSRLRDLTGVSPAAPPAPVQSAEADLGDAFFAAGSYERQMMLTNLGDAGPSVTRRSPAAAVETCRRLEAAVLTHNIAEFRHLIERALMLPRAVAEKIATDNSGEPIVIVAKALGMPSSALQRILLLINPAIGHSVQRVYELAALYDEIDASTAETMIDIWRGGTQRRRGTHQSALWDDEQRSSRAAMTPSRYNSNRRSDALAARFRNSGR